MIKTKGINMVAAPDQAAGVLEPTLQERLKRVRKIQERTVRRNQLLHEGSWRTEEDALDVVILPAVKHA